MENYIFERVSEKNLIDLTLLFKKNGKEFSDSYFKKKFDTEYTGKKYIGFFAYHKSTKEVAGFYGVFPTLINYKGKTILAAQSGDTITDSNHQKKGIFIQLAKMTYELAKDESIEFIFGFPNKNSAPGFYTKLDWEKAPSFYSVELENKKLSIYNLCNKLGLPKFYAAFLNRILKKNKCDVKEFNPAISAVFFNENYFEYKKFEKSYLMTVNDFNFWFKLEDGVIIGDVGKFEFSSSNEFLATLTQIMKLLSVKKLKIEFQENTSLFELFKKNQYKIEESTINLGFLILTDSSMDLKDLSFSISDTDTF